MTRRLPAWRRPTRAGTRRRHVRAPGRQAGVAFTVSRERIRAERARTLRRLGRPGEAAAAWQAIAVAGGPGSARAWVEVAKVREHGLADHAGALAATAAAEAAAERSRLLQGMSDSSLRNALAQRRRRLVRKARPLRGRLPGRTDVAVARR